MKPKLLACLLTVLLGLISTVLAVDTTSAEDAIQPRLSTDEVENQITLDRKANPLYESKLLTPLRNWRDEVAEKTGLNLSLDYSALFMGVSESPGEDSASSGMVRFFGFWDLLNRGRTNKGSLNWKVENRHRYTDIPPSALPQPTCPMTALLGLPLAEW
jgi:porin